MMDAGLFSDYCVGNFELILIIKIIFLNNQNRSYDITLTSETNKKSLQSDKFRIQNTKFWRS